MLFLSSDNFVIRFLSQWAAVLTGSRRRVAANKAIPGSVRPISTSRYRARTRRTPSSTSRNLAGGNLPTRPVRNDLSSVTICETLTTDARPKPTLRLESSTLPGAAASCVVDVIAATTTVPMRLRVNSSLCRMTTGRLNPGSEADGSGRSAHHTSPRFIYQSSLSSVCNCISLRLGSRSDLLPEYTSSSLAVTSSVR